MIKPLGKFWEGFLSPISGMKLISKHKQLRLWAWIPAAIVGVIWFLGIGGGWGLIATALTPLLPVVSGFWTGLLYYVALLFGYVLFAALLSFSLFYAAGILAAPFNAILAEKALKIEGLIPERKKTVREILVISLRMMFISLSRAALFAGLGVLVFLVSFIPGVQPLIWFIGATFLAMDCVDYSQEIMERGFRDRFKLYKDFSWEIAGLGTALGLTLFVPGLNFLVYPSAVVGGGVLVAKKLINREALERSNSQSIIESKI